MATKTTGVFWRLTRRRIRHAEIDLCNYGSRSHQMQVTVNRFLHVGRKSRVLRKEITVNSASISSKQQPQAAVECSYRGLNQYVPASLLFMRSGMGIIVLLQIPPGMFSTL